MLVLERGPMDNGVPIVGGVIDKNLSYLYLVKLTHRNDILPSLKQGLHGPRIPYSPSPPSQLLGGFMRYAFGNGRVVDGKVFLHRLPPKSQKPPRADEADVGG